VTFGERAMELTFLRSRAAGGEVLAAPMGVAAYRKETYG
jgi:hypothetical protein